MGDPVGRDRPLVLVGIVGFMLLALYLPIFNLGQAMRSGLMGQ